MEKKVLTLTVSKEWFDKIVDGTKDEEYREIKLYWLRRFTKDAKGGYSYLHTEDGKFINLTLESDFRTSYTHVLFINGYGKNRLRIEKEIESITIGKPKRGLCPDEFLNNDYFVIKFK